MTISIVSVLSLLLVGTAVQGQREQHHHPGRDKTESPITPAQIGTNWGALAIVGQPNTSIYTGNKESFRLLLLTDPGSELENGFPTSYYVFYRLVVIIVQGPRARYMLIGLIASATTTIPKLMCSCACRNISVALP